MSLLRQIGAELPGIEQLQRMAQEDRQPGMGVTLGMRIAEIGEGRVTLTASPGPHVENTNAVAQGGFAAALLDMACGYAVISRLPAGRTCSTLELKVAYHKAMDDKTGPVRAEAVVTTIGRRVAFTEGRLTDRGGRLLATATSTLLVIAP